MIVFACPHCHLKIEVAPEHAGKSGKCQRCGGVIVVPQPEPDLPTSLDALRQAPSVASAPPERFGAYGKNADAQWQDPAAQAEAEAPKAKPEEIVLPVDTIPQEVLAKAKARKRQTVQYLIAALVLAVILLFLMYPLFLPKPPPETPAEIPPAPKFGQDETAPE